MSESLDVVEKEGKKRSRKDKFIDALRLVLIIITIVLCFATTTIFVKIPSGGLKLDLLICQPRIFFMITIFSMVVCCIPLVYYFKYVKRVN